MCFKEHNLIELWAPSTRANVVSSVNADSRARTAHRGPQSADVGAAALLRATVRYAFTVNLHAPHSGLPRVRSTLVALGLNTLINSFKGPITLVLLFIFSSPPVSRSSFFSLQVAFPVSRSDNMPWPPARRLRRFSVDPGVLLRARWVLPLLFFVCNLYGAVDSAVATPPPAPAAAPGASLIESRALSSTFNPLSSRTARVISLQAGDINVSGAIRAMRTHAVSPAPPRASPLARFATLAAAAAPRPATSASAQPGILTHAVTLRNGRSVDLSVPYRTFRAPAHSHSHNHSNGFSAAHVFASMSADAGSSGSVGASSTGGELRQWLVHLRGPVTDRTRTMVRGQSAYWSCFP
jgi:hypothetical protein